MQFLHRSDAVRRCAPALLVLMYVAVSSGWIVAKDRLAAEWLLRSPSTKGLLFVGVPGVILYLLASHLCSTTKRMETTLGHLEEVLKSLRSSEARFKRLVESNLLGIALIASNGRIVDANDVLLRMLGYSREELLAGNLRWDQITATRCRALDEKAWRDLREKRQHAPYQKEFIAKNGTPVPVLVGGGVISEDVNEVIEVAVSVFDLRDAKKAEAQMSRLALAVENAHESIMITDLDANIVYVNPAFENLTGYSRAEVTGRNPKLLQSGKTSKQTIESMWLALKTRRFGRVTSSTAEKTDQIIWKKQPSRLSGMHRGT